MGSWFWAQHYTKHQYRFQTATADMWPKQSVCGSVLMVCELHAHSTICSSLTFVTFLVRSKQNMDWAESFISQIISCWPILFVPSVRWRWSNLIRLKCLLRKLQRGSEVTIFNVSYSRPFITGWTVLSILGPFKCGQRFTTAVSPNRS